MSYAVGMDQLERTGFSLFPMPPTPPAKRQRPQVPLTEPPPPTITIDSPKVGSQHQNSEIPHLRPPPLKLRKKKLVAANQPCTTSSPLIGSEGFQPTPAEDVEPVPPLSTQVEAPQLEAFPLLPTDDVESRSETLLPPTVSSARASSVLVPDFPAPTDNGLQVPEESRGGTTFRRTAPSSNRVSSYRRSQWLDGEGQVDRKKLSMYLSGVLDTSFNVDTDRADHTPLPLDARRSIREHEGRDGQEAWRLSHFFNEWRQSYRPKDTPTTKGCRCPEGVVMCQCHSSPEFERFRRVQSDHKANPSVSSTKCIIGVPRARFRTTLGQVEEVDTPSSPPELMYDSEESDEFDWSLPNSPTFAGRRHHYMDTPTPAPRQPGPHRAPVPSFSLPFSHGKQIRPRFQADQRPPMPGGQQPSPSTTIPTLASISTVSTFTFDFNDDDDETEYDPFDEQSEMSEIRTWEPVSKAKPVLVHCRGPSPHSIKFGNYGNYVRHQVDHSGSYTSAESWGFGYATVFVR